MAARYRAITLDASGLSPVATASYGLVLGMAAVGYALTERAIVACNGSESVLARAIGADRKGKVSVALYLVAVPAAFFARPLALALYLTVLALWLVPDHRIERALKG